MNRSILVVRDNQTAPPPKYAVSVVDETGFGEDLAYFFDLKTASAFALWYSIYHRPERDKSKNSDK